MKTVQLGLLLLFALVIGDSRGTDAAAPLELPHAQAIRLVMQARASQIEKLDESAVWLHDTKERSWSAKRPFEPGVMNSSHLFSVAYAIEGRVVAAWIVNIRTGEVFELSESIQFE